MKEIAHIWVLSPVLSPIYKSPIQIKPHNLIIDFDSYLAALFSCLSQFAFPSSPFASPSSQEEDMKVKILRILLLHFLCISCIQSFDIFSVRILVINSQLVHIGWHAVASWTWDAQDETCGICRMPFDGCCPDCKLPGDDCPLIWGACNHSFHLHCILKWVNSQTSQAHCSMCRREWQARYVLITLGFMVVLV
ncbi:hypothetical protein IGI04_008353 [Brassica rapa subsp. trilocularis]|uniref:Anaphase-promoting complex subunit 11 n=1 Tax=Brassica rapa subsp. trilocularis TaxID=1813537 RepID=A0ABQ7NQM1_BRACM|nr:hypothetical protein IGI04_008353 [Brassica rapa subsp. trilocularis]